ncbi:MAG: M23 family metallopeptidase [Dermatophilaceae bacterium]
MSRTFSVAAALLAAAVSGLYLLLAAAPTPAGALLAAGSGDEPAGAGGVCNVAAAAGVRIDLTPDQIAAARTIITVGAQLKVPERGHVVAIATAMQESTLRADLTEAQSDRDSAGLFQQRRPWGPLADRTNAAKASAMFYTGGQGGQPGLLDIDGWQTMPITRAAQAVQVSAFPDAYARWEPLARSIVAGTSVACTDAAAAVPAGTWTAPLRKGAYQITSDFGPRSCSGPCSTFHKGVDLGAPEGTPVQAAAAGRVIFSGTMGTYGQMIEIDHGGGITTRHAHLSLRIAQTGQTVRGGQTVGEVGNTGRSYGAHLHFEVRTNATPIDPVPFLRAKGITL